VLARPEEKRGGGKKEQRRMVTAGLAKEELVSQRGHVAQRYPKGHKVKEGELAQDW